MQWDWHAEKKLLLNRRSRGNLFSFSSMGIPFSNYYECYDNL